MKKLLGAVAGLALLVTAVGPAVAADRNVAAIRTISGGSSLISQINSIGVGTDGTVYASSPGTDKLYAYAPTAGANAVPARRIDSGKSMINTPTAVAVDAQNRVWTTLNFGTYGIGLFPGTSNGDVAPIRSIGGSNTQLSNGTTIYGIAIGPNGDIYLASPATDTVFVFDAAAGGNVDPKRVLQGGNTLLDAPQSIAVDSAGNLYVLGADATKVSVFANGANGNVPPVRTITGPATRITAASSLAVDNGRNLYVSDYATDAISVFGPAANGNVAPLTRLVGAGTQIVNATSIAVGTDRRVYVLDGGGLAIRVFAPLVPFVKAGPVRSLKVSGTKTSKTRTVTWAAPTANLNATAVTAYRVVIKKGSKTLVSKTVPAGVRSLSVKRSKLRTGTLTVKVLAVNKQGSGPVATKTFKVRR